MNKITAFSLLLFSLFFFNACNKYDGNEITLYYSDSIPKIRVFYKYSGNKKVIVKQERYYPNGQIESTGKLNSAGQKTGKWEYFFENGKKWMIENYKNGKLNGKKIEWYKSGQKMYEGEYTNGLPSGTWIIWDENGKKISREKY